MNEARVKKMGVLMVSGLWCLLLGAPGVPGACLAGDGGRSVHVTFTVDMYGEPISEDGVHVAGTFNEWDPGATEMVDPEGDSIYTVGMMILEGSFAQYKFINGADFAGAEGVPAACGQEDGYGGYNRAFVVPLIGGEQSYVFGTCEPIERFVLELDAGWGAVYTEGTLRLDFTVGCREPVTWAVYMILTAPEVQVIPLWSVPLPAVHPPYTIPTLSFPLPGLGIVGIWTGLFSASGLQASEIAWVETE